MAKTKEEALAELRRATRYGNMSAAELSKLTRAEQDEFAHELSLYMGFGQNDADRDAAQSERLNRLAGEVASL